jgi:hypothetical protein
LSIWFEKGARFMRAFSFVFWKLNVKVLSLSGYASWSESFSCMPKRKSRKKMASQTDWTSATLALIQIFNGPGLKVRPCTCRIFYGILAANPESYFLLGSQ